MGKAIKGYRKFIKRFKLQNTRYAKRADQEKGHKN